MGGELEAFARDPDLVAASHHGLHFPRRRFQHHGGDQLVHGLPLLERLLDRLVALGAGGRQVDAAFRPAIAVAAVVVEHALAHRLVGRLLVASADRGVDPEPAHVRRLAVLLDDRGARHLGDVVGAQRKGFALAGGREVERLGERRLVLLVGDPAHVVHPAQHVVLAFGRPLGIHDGVLPGGRLGEARQHRGLGRREVLQALPEVHVGGRGESIGPLAQVDLVDVELEDLVLGEVRLDLEREEDLGELPGEGLLAREEEGARHLHRDRAGAFPAPLQVRHGGPDHAREVDAPVLVEPVVLGGQDRRLHHPRHVLDLHDRPLFLAELADEVAFRAVDAQRHLRAVVGERFQAGQVGPQQHDREGRHTGRHQGEGGGDEGRIEPPTGSHRYEMEAGRDGRPAMIGWNFGRPA
jgi:hypothetical protein